MAESLVLTVFLDLQDRGGCSLWGAVLFRIQEFNSRIQENSNKFKKIKKIKTFQKEFKKIKKFKKIKTFQKNSKK